jgi:hypothetical protein
VGPNLSVLSHVVTVTRPTRSGSDGGHFLTCAGSQKNPSDREQSSGTEISMKKAQVDKRISLNNILRNVELTRVDLGIALARPGPAGFLF